ncbi:MAG: YkgJ family cysteine cluster protein [Dehalococcoidales bacterium]
MEDKPREPEEIGRLNLEKYGLAHLKDNNILALNTADLNKLLDALAADDISINLPIPCTPYNVDGVLSYSECRKCGKCCLPNPQNPGSPGVEILEEELKTIATHLNLPYETLKQQTVEGKNILSLDQIDNVAVTRRLPLPCPFYQQESNECRVYEVRPIVCTVYPVIFGENSTYIAIKVNCDYGRDIAVRAFMYLKTNNPDLVLKL